MKGMAFVIALLFVYSAAHAQATVGDYRVEHKVLNNYSLFAEAGGGFITIDGKYLEGFVNVGASGMALNNRLMIELNSRLLGGPVKRTEAVLGYIFDQDIDYPVWADLQLEGVGGTVSGSSVITTQTYSVQGHFVVKQENSKYFRAGYISQDSDPVFDDVDVNQDIFNKAQATKTQGGKFSGAYIGYGILTRVNTSAYGTKNYRTVEEEYTDKMGIDLIAGNGDEIALTYLYSGSPRIETKSQKLKYGGRIYYSSTGTNGGSFSQRYEMGYIANYLYISMAFGFNFGF